MVELLIAVLVGLAITAAIGGAFVAWLTAEGTARAREEAVGEALRAQESLQSALRNADWTGTRALSDGTQLLLARVAVGSAGWQCQAWGVTTGGEFVLRAQPAAFASPVDVSGWGVLARGVQPGPGGGFAVSGDVVQYRWEITRNVGGIEVTAPLEGRVRAAALGEGGSDPC